MLTTALLPLSITSLLLVLLVFWVFLDVAVPVLLVLLHFLLSRAFYVCLDFCG